MTDADKEKVVNFEVETIVYVDIPANLVKSSDEIVVSSDQGSTGN